jgi:segregation and condensation protein A
MFQIEIEGFSGPLDLLCHMIDQKEIEASQISVSQVISIYVAYLAKTEELSISAAADFISQAAHLVRQKTFSLLPQYDISEDELSDEPALLEEQDLPRMIERYRPYRKAAAVLAELKEKADKRRLRRADAPEPFFDLGDLYSLSKQWLALLNRRRQQALSMLENEDFEDDGVPAEIPEEVQVENRMSRILERLKIFSSGLSMRLLLKEEPGRTSLVVTLLALLELSRRNRVALLQKELFGDVFITARDE